jgi:hypothetical protein
VTAGASACGWSSRRWAAAACVGSLANDPLDFPRLHFGHKIKFRREHIIDIDTDPHTLTVERQHNTVCAECCGANESDALASRGIEDGAH